MVGYGVWSIQVCNRIEHIRKLFLLCLFAGKRVYGEFELCVSQREHTLWL